MTHKVHNAILLLGDINAADLDACTVEELAQLQYWLAKHQGAIFVKTVGRLSANMEKLHEA